MDFPPVHGGSVQQLIFGLIVFLSCLSSASTEHRGVPIQHAEQQVVESVITPTEVPVKVLRNSFRRMRHHHQRGIDRKTLEYSFRSYFDQKAQENHDRTVAEKKKHDEEVHAHLEAAKQQEEKEREKHQNLPGVVVAATKDKSDEVVRPASYEESHAGKPKHHH